LEDDSSGGFSVFINIILHALEVFATKCYTTSKTCVEDQLLNVNEPNEKIGGGERRNEIPLCGAGV
jgi:hypothetical protein